jgi:hypothetical protein
MSSLESDDRTWDAEEFDGLISAYSVTACSFTSFMQQRPCLGEAAFMQA